MTADIIAATLMVAIVALVAWLPAILIPARDVSDRTRKDSTQS